MVTFRKNPRKCGSTIMEQMEDKADFTGRVFSGYRVEERLGQGGMGIVYRALDLQLGRPVALKFLSPSARLDAGSRARLLAEAQAAAALNHPNICTIYAVSEAEGQLFIAMEYLEGSDVETMARHKPLAWEQAISICQHAGRALEEAHGRGIVHRDVKSANIFLTRQGVTKLLDFGIASFRQDPEGTRTIQVFGTPNYMAPEQIDLGIADAQSDIWALGVVLYEMLTGTLPFGQNGKSALSSVLTEEPARIGTLHLNVPNSIDRIISRALAKNRKDRYPAVGEMIADLEVVNSRDGMHTQVQAESRTVAVLPLLNLSPDPADDFLCDGLAEELINGLTQIEGLRVVSRSSSFQCKGTALDVREIGRKLRASHLVQGSLRRSGDQLRLTAQLSETREGYQLWSHRFDAGMKDLFTLQDELTEAILKRLGPKLARTPAVRSTVNSAAHELYLRARHLMNRQTGEALRQALEYLAQALTLDPEQAHAHVAVAECHALLEWYGLEPGEHALPLVRSALDAGLRLEPDYVPGLCLLATVQAGYDWDWAAAERTFNRAIAAGAGFADVQFHYALDLLTPLGRLHEALAAIRCAVDLDPLSAITNTALGGCYYRMRRWNDAALSLRTTLEFNPGFGHAHWSLGRVLLEQGEGNEALRHFDEAIRIIGRTPQALAERGYALGRLGQRLDAQAILDELRAMSKGRFVPPLSSALVHAGMGDNAAALSCLDQAFEQRARQLVWINADPRFDSLRSETAFRRLLHKLGLANADRI